VAGKTPIAIRLGRKKLYRRRDLDLWVEWGCPARNADPTEEHAKKPLAEHAKDFRRYLTAKGNTAFCVEEVSFPLTAGLDGCHFVRIADVQSSAILRLHLRAAQQ
jgi:hypothetical protein